ncbi:MAG: hypothetical protein ABWZ25_17810 [Chitinophagaceae bacterium]
MNEKTGFRATLAGDRESDTNLFIIATVHFSKSTNAPVSGNTAGTSAQRHKG